MDWRSEEASAPIYLDGNPTGYLTVDAQHRVDLAVHLCCERVWGSLYARDEIEYDTNGNDWSA